MDPIFLQQTREFRRGSFVPEPPARPRPRHPRLQQVQAGLRAQASRLEPEAPGVRQRVLAEAQRSLRECELLIKIIARTNHI